MIGKILVLVPLLVLASLWPVPGCGGSGESWYLVDGELRYSEHFDSACLAPDGGYLLFGVRHPVGIWDSYEAVVMKVSPRGEKEWLRVIASGGMLHCYASGTSDGGYVVALGEEVWKLNSKLEVEWKSNTGPPLCVRQTSDGGYIVGVAGGVCKLDSKGRIQWRTGLYEFKYVYRVKQTPDGYVAASAENLFKLDPFGRVVRRMRVPGEKGEGYTFFVTSGCLFVEELSSRVYKLDSDWRVEWSIDLGLGKGNVSSIRELENGDFLILFTLHTDDGTINGAAFSRVTPRGEVRWTRYFARGKKLSLDDMELTPDGGCIACGIRGRWEPGPSSEPGVLTYWDSGDYLAMRMGPDLVPPQWEGEPGEGSPGSSGGPSGGLPLAWIGLGSGAAVLLLILLVRLRRRREAELGWDF